MTNKQMVSIKQREFLSEVSLGSRVKEIAHKMKDTVSKDPLIERIGTHGKFQLRAFLIIQFVGVFAGWQLLVSYMSRTCPSQNLQPSSISSRPEASSFPRLTTGAALLAWNWPKGRDRRQTLARDLRRTQQTIAWCMT